MPRKENATVYKYISDFMTISMLIVVFWHCMLFFVDNPFFPEGYGTPSISVTYLSKIFDVTVIAGYVFCSGFLFANSLGRHTRTVLGRVGERTKRLLIPYYLYGIIWLVPLYTIFDIKSFGRPDGAGLLEGYKAMLLGQFSDHLWYLWMLFWVALFFILISKLVKKDHLLILSIVTIVAAVVVELFLQEFPYFKLSQIGPYLVCYLLGIVFFWHKDKIVTLPKRVKRLLTLVLFVGLIVYPFIKADGLIFLYIFRALGCMFGCFLFMVLEENTLWQKCTDGKVYEWISRYRMDMYLVNMPLNYLVFRMIVPTLGVYPWLCILATFTVTMTGIILIVLVKLSVKEKLFKLWRGRRV